VTVTAGRVPSRASPRRPPSCRPVAAEARSAALRPGNGGTPPAPSPPPGIRTMPQNAFRAGKAAIAFIMITALLDIVSMGIVIPVLPKLIEEFAGSNERAGIVNGLFVALWALMQFVSSPVIGSLSDHYGRRPVILVSTLG